MKIHRFVPALACAATVAALAAQDPASPPKLVEVPATKAAAAELERALRFLQSLPEVSLSARATRVPPEVPEDLGMRIEFEPIPPFRIEFQRAAPRRFVLRTFTGQGDDLEWLVASDGVQLLQAHGIFGFHSIKPFPAGRSPFATQEAPNRIDGAASLRSLFTPSGGDKALVDAKVVALLGEETQNGKPSLHLAVRDEGLACEVWVQTGREPWVLRLKPRPAVLDLAAPSLDLGAGDVDLDVTTWSKELPRDAFRLVPPKKSQAVEDLAGALREEWAKKQEAMVDREAQRVEQAGPVRAGGGAADKPHPSVGKAAPDVVITMLDGTTRKLADLKGKVVVLDFWATWCVPCVAGLPKVAEVTKKFADRGLVFLAMNAAEKKATIDRFLARKQLDVSVGLADKEFGKAFGVDGIPHTVVIGTDGVIRMVHVGYEPGDEQRLEAELLEVLGEKPEAK